MVVLNSKLLLAGSVKTFFIFGSHSGKVLCQCPFIPSGLFDPVDYGRDNWSLSFEPLPSQG